MVAYTFDTVVYGTTEAAIFAAIAARRERPASRVALISENRRIQNFSTGGLGRADIGKARVLGGLYATFAKMTGGIYGAPRSYPFTPRKIEMLLAQWLGSWGVVFVPDQQVASVQVTGTAITQLTMVSGDTFAATHFVDGSLMGDVMMRCMTRGVGWTIGSESASAYGESLAGYGKMPVLRTGIVARHSDGKRRTGVSPVPGLAAGDASDAIAVPGVRTIVTDDRANTFPWARSSDLGIAEGIGYDREDYRLRASLITTDGIFRPAPVSAGRYDLNSVLFLTDDAGRPLHWDYALKTYAERAAIDTAFLYQMRGSLYFTATDADHAGQYQTTQQEYGVPRDEYTATRRFTTAQPYYREGPRLIGEYVMTQMDVNSTDITQPRHYLKDDVICLGGYSLDIKPTMLIEVVGSSDNVIIEGAVEGEQGGTRAAAPNGYQVPYRAILPKRVLITNLVVVYTASWSHVAWGSGRIICTNAMMGEAGGVAIGLSQATGVALHDVPYASLSAKLLGYGAKLVPTAFADGEEPDDPDEPEDPEV